MRAETEDRLPIPPTEKKFPLLKLLTAFAILAALIVLWLWSGQSEQPAPITPEVITPAVIPEPEVPPTPDIPEPPLPEAATVVVDSTPVVEEAVAPPALPTAEETDEILRQQLDAAGADDLLDGLVSHEHPMDVSAALIDGMSRGAVLRKILPMDAPTTAFSVDGENDMLYMGEDSYQRYDSYTDSIVALDVTALVASFHQMRPFYERAYQQLGLDPKDFDNAIIRTLDVILATPEIAQPIALEREKVMYTYADPTLEALPDLQKQLLRMGPENIRRIKAQATALRAGLLQP
ncbi:MAG: DUF3014 domain-containing protein [Halioglobus sp.]